MRAPLRTAVLVAAALTVTACSNAPKEEATATTVAPKHQERAAAHNEEPCADKEGAAHPTPPHEPMGAPAPDGATGEAPPPGVPHAPEGEHAPEGKHAPEGEHAPAPDVAAPDAHGAATDATHEAPSSGEVHGRSFARRASGEPAAPPAAPPGDAPTTGHEPDAGPESADHTAAGPATPPGDAGHGEAPTMDSPGHEAPGHEAPGHAGPEASATHAGEGCGDHGAPKGAHGGGRSGTTAAGHSGATHGEGGEAAAEDHGAHCTEVVLGVQDVLHHYDSRRVDAQTAVARLGELAQGAHGELGEHTQALWRAAAELFPLREELAAQGNPTHDSTGLANQGDDVERFSELGRELQTAESEIAAYGEHHCPAEQPKTEAHTAEGHAAE